MVAARIATTDICGLLNLAQGAMVEARSQRRYKQQNQAFSSCTDFGKLLKPALPLASAQDEPPNTACNIFVLSWNLCNN
jgi:hypothetical protein